MNQLWQAELERLGGQQLVALLTELRDNQVSMRGDVEQITKKVAVLQQSSDLILSGFPANDVDGHRRYHQAVIEWRELRNNMARQALEKVIGAGILGACGWLLLAIWQSFKITVTK